MDTIEAKKNLQRYEAEITKWQSLSRGLMSREEMMLADRKIAQFKEWSASIEWQLKQNRG